PVGCQADHPARAPHTNSGTRDTPGRLTANVSPVPVEQCRSRCRLTLLPGGCPIETTRFPGRSPRRHHRATDEGDQPPRGRWTMADASAAFTSERAPCGKRVSGHRHREDDESGMVFDDVNYDCGCRTI